MSLEKLLFTGFSILFSIVLLLNIYFVYRIKKHREDPSNIAKSRLSGKATFRYGLFLLLFYTYCIALSIHQVWIGKFSLLLGIGFIIGSLILIRKPVIMLRDNPPVRAEREITLPLMPRLTNAITPELLLEILGEDSVMKAVKIDMQRTHQIGGKEQWRLGLLEPGTDMYNLSYNQLSREERFRKGLNPIIMSNLANQVPIKRAAILHPTSYFNTQFNTVMILHGTRAPMIRSYPGWSYHLRSRIPDKDYKNIRDVEINTESMASRDRSSVFQKFLQEDGFPLKDTYPDGDPLTTERGGTLVIDKGQIKIIHSNYFIQSRLIDDEGNLVYMGLDENFQSSATWSGVSIIPSISRRLYKCVTYNDYIPILRYRSFPYSSNFMLPILDTPMSDSGWADLFIDTRGKAKLFIAKQKTLEEWCEMMARLRQLFFSELTRNNYHLLGLTKDLINLNSYLVQKQMILDEYYTVMDWSLV